MQVPGILSLTLAAAVGWIGATAFQGNAQDGKPKAQGGVAEAAMPMPKITKHHKLLASDAGEWAFEAKMWMGPGEPVAWQGTEKTRVAGGGLWQISELKGTFMGRPFEGHGVLGYDSNKRKYRSVWFDNFSDYLTIGEGTVSADGKVRTIRAKMPGMDGTMLDTRMVYTSKDAGSRLFEMFSKMPTGEMKSLEIRYTRKK